MNHTEDAKVVSYGIPSDHSAIKLKLKFKVFEKKKSETVKIIDWNLLLDDDIKKKYNSSLSKSLGKIKNSEDIYYTDFSNSIIEASNDVASTIKSDSSGWYNHSKHILQPLIDKRSTVLNDIRQLDYSTSEAKEMAKEARKNLSEGISLAKSRWSGKLADRIHDMANYPKDAWKAVFTLKEWL